MRTEIDLNESEIDLNECEHFFTSSMDRSEIDLTWVDLINPIIPQKYRAVN